jgi:hypothetical protein
MMLLAVIWAQYYFKFALVGAQTPKGWCGVRFRDDVALVAHRKENMRPNAPDEANGESKVCAAWGDVVGGPSSQLAGWSEQTTNMQLLAAMCGYVFAGLRNKWMEQKDGGVAETNIYGRWMDGLSSRAGGGRRRVCS